MLQQTNFIMKTNYLKQLLVLAFVFLAKNVMLSQVVGDFTVSKPENGSFTYHWTDPVLQTVNIDSVRKQKEKSENHLKGLNLLDDRLQSNRKELKMLTKQANDEAKVISNERKYLAEKKRFSKDEEKFLKTEKSLRDKEIKQIISERKDLKKKSKDLDKDDVRSRIASLDEKDSKIKDLESQWNVKRDNLKNNIDAIAETESKLDRREVDVKNRLRKLDCTKATLDLKAKQLDVEKQQTKLEIKKSRTLLKK